MKLKEELERLRESIVLLERENEKILRVYSFRKDCLNRAYRQIDAMCDSLDEIGIVVASEEELFESLKNLQNEKFNFNEGDFFEKIKNELIDFGCIYNNWLLRKAEQIYNKACVNDDWTYMDIKSELQYLERSVEINVDNAIKVKKEIHRLIKLVPFEY